MAKKARSGLLQPGDSAPEWKPFTNFPVDPKLAVKKLDLLIARHGGSLTPAQLVSAAQPRNSFFHDCFEWNDSVAACEYRLEQARNLMRSIVVFRQSTGDTPVRLLHNVVVNRTGPQTAYVPAQVALTVHRVEVLDEAMSDLMAFESKYRSLSVLSGLMKTIHALLTKYKAKKLRLVLRNK